MSYVFISHAKSDDATAAPLISALKKAGLRVWTPADLSPADDFREKTAHALQTAKCVIVLWSKAAAASEWVRVELEHAIQAWSSDRLLLVVLDDTVLPIGLNDLTPISLKEPEIDALQIIVQRAKTIIGHAKPSHRLMIWSLLASILAISISASTYLLLKHSARAPVPIPETVNEHSSGTLDGRPVPEDPSVLSPAAVPATPAPPSPPFYRVAVQWIEDNPIKTAIFFAILSAFLGGEEWSRRRQHSKSSDKPLSTLELVAPSPGALQVFISYSHKDLSTVDGLVAQIQKLGYGIWIDREMTGAVRYAGPIVRAMRSSRLVAMMCSANALKSNNVIRELYVAGDLQKPFIVFLLDSSEYSDDFHYFLSGFPRLPISTLNTNNLRAEIARLIVA